MFSALDAGEEKRLTIIEEVAEKMGITTRELGWLLHSPVNTGRAGEAKALVAGYGVRVITDFPFGKTITYKPLGNFTVTDGTVKTPSSGAPKKADRPPASDEVSLAWEGEVPTVRLSTEIAAMLTLSPIDSATPPASVYRVRIMPAYCGLETIDVNSADFRGTWSKGPPAGADLSQPLRNIALGACDLLTKSSIPREAKEPDPITKTQARMHDVVLVRIRTAVSDAIRAAATEVMEGRRGYSQVLAESIPVRAHLARYRVGPGRTQTVLVLRAAHRRGGPGTRQRTYVLKT